MVAVFIYLGRMKAGLLLWVSPGIAPIFLLNQHKSCRIDVHGQFLPKFSFPSLKSWNSRGAREHYLSHRYRNGSK